MLILCSSSVRDSTGSSWGVVPNSTSGSDASSWACPDCDASRPAFGTTSPTYSKSSNVNDLASISARLHHFNLDTSETESAQTFALHDIAEESETPIQTLSDHFDDTVARKMRATGVQQNVLPAELHQFLMVWFGLPEMIRFAILNWNDIPDDTRCALESMVRRQMKLGGAVGTSTRKMTARFRRVQTVGHCPLVLCRSRRVPRGS